MPRSLCRDRKVVDKKHTTTDGSSTASELTEGSLCACDIVGFRNLNGEVGLRADGPTVMFQDNQAAIQIMMNRGSLSQRSKATDIRTLTVRNKVEDLLVVPIYLETSAPKPWIPSSLQS